ncbi:MAG: diguanylate cyclase, partial [Bdellovibrionota bacterium]
FLRDDLDPNRDYYQVRAFHGVPDTFIDSKGREEALQMFKFERNTGLLWQLIQQGDIFSVRDLNHDPRLKTAWREWNLEVLQSDVWCPLLRGSDVLGVITLGETWDGRQIPESDYPFLQELASIAATNIDAVLKYEKNSRILRNIQTLYDINQQIANVNDFKKLSIETLSTAVEALRAQKGNLMLWNKERQLLELRVVWGNIPSHVRDSINSGQTEPKTFKRAEGIAGQVFDSGRPIRVNDRDSIPQVGAQEAYCMASVPIIYGGNVEGVINMTNKVRQNEKGEWELAPLGRYNSDDMSLLQGLTDQAAVNLNRMRNYAASITDRMTDLYNTRHFENTLALEFSKSIETGRSLYLAVSDIDHFKKFNDTYGHKAGDEVLKAVARVLKASCRENRSGSFDDMVFRYGGEEYCMILPATSAAEALEVIEKYRAAVEALVVQYEGKELKVKCSIGLAGVPDDTKEFKELFVRADDALYACKEGGRNQVRIFHGGKKSRYSPELVREVFAASIPVPVKARPTAEAA